MKEAQTKLSFHVPFQICLKILRLVAVTCKHYQRLLETLNPSYPGLCVDATSLQGWI